jgi:hypothetical protein
VEEDSDRDEKDSKPSAVTCSLRLMGSSREVVREEVTRGEIPSFFHLKFPLKELSLQIVHACKINDKITQNTMA